MNYLKVLICSALMLLPGVAFGQQAREGLPPHCTVAQLAAGTCAPALPGMRVRITDGNLAIDADCTAGVGAISTVCVFTTGGAWVTEPAVPADMLDFDDFMDIMTLDADTEIIVGTGDEFTITADAQVGIDEIITILIDQDDDADATDILQAIRIELASESGDAGDLLYGIMMTVEEGTANTIIDAAIHIDNEETTAATLTDAIIITSSGAAAGVTDGLDVSAANITNAINIGVNTILGANDDFITMGVVDNEFKYNAGGAATVNIAGDDDDNIAETHFDTTGAGIVQLGSADVTEVSVVSDQGTIGMTGGVSIPSEATGGNAGAKNEFVGLPRISMAALGALGNGPVLSEPLTPTAALCAPVGGGAEADDAAVYRDTVTDVTAYRHTFVAVVGVGEGFDCDFGPAPAAISYVSVGFWFRSSVTFDAGDLEINLLDAAVVEGDGDLPAYGTADVWQWMEVDVTADCAAAACADIDGVELLTTAVAPTTFNAALVYMDSGAVWIAGCEETLGADIPYDGVLSLLAGVTAGGDTTLLVQGTDYIVHYQTGNDAVCMITNQAANYGMALYAY